MLCSIEIILNKIHEFYFFITVQHTGDTDLGQADIRLRHLPLESMLYRLQHVGWLVGWLVVLGIYVALAVFQSYRDLEAGDNQSLKFKWRDRESNPGPLAPQAKSTGANYAIIIMHIHHWL